MTSPRDSLSRREFIASASAAALMTAHASIAMDEPEDMKPVSAKRAASNSLVQRVCAIARGGVVVQSADAGTHCASCTIASMNSDIPNPATTSRSARRLPQTSETTSVTRKVIG